MNLLVSLGAALLAWSFPGAVRVEHNLFYAPGSRGQVDVYLPRRPNPGAPLVVFFYGGSWQSGDKSLYRFVGVALASRGIVTVIPNYRVFPEVRYPTFLEDNARAVDYARGRAPDWGADPRRLYLVGHSAGAYNVAMLALDRRWLGQAGMDPRRDIKGVVGLAGPYDFLPLRDPKLMTIFNGPEGLADTQPIVHVEGSAPPMALLAGEDDKVVEPSNTIRLGSAIRAHGGAVTIHLYPHLGHVGLLTSVSGLFRARSSVLNDITAFIYGDPDLAPASTAPVAAVSPLPAGA